MTGPLNDLERVQLADLATQADNLGLHVKAKALRHALALLAPEPSDTEACARCGRIPAAGLATLGAARYCHPYDTPDGTSCYELTHWEHIDAVLNRSNGGVS